MKKINFIFSLAIIFIISLQVHATEIDTIATIGFEGNSLPAGWSSLNTSFSSNSHDEFTGEKGLRLRWDTAQFVTSEYEDVGVFSFYFKFSSNGYNENTTLQVLKSTDGGVEWQPIDTFTLDVGVYAKDDWHLLSYIINESNAMMKVVQDVSYNTYKDNAGLYIDDLVLTKIPTFSPDNVEIATVLADTTTVSYEEISFTLKEGTDDIYLAHDSIAYGTNDVTITATAVAPAANIIYTKQTVNPAPGVSDTAVWVVTAEDGITTKTYKAVVARSEFQCKAGLLTGGSADKKPVGWFTAGANYPSDSKGNGGLYPGDYAMRIYYSSDKGLGSVTTPEFSQIGTLTFAAKFSKTDDETLTVLSSIDGGSTWDNLKVYTTAEGEIPSYSTEASSDALATQTLSINKKNVMIRFQYAGASTSSRTMIDDIACKATDYVDIATGIETNELSETNFMIYPNPASDFIQIQGDATEISIYSLSGRLLKQTNHLESVDVSDLFSGVYLVKADNNIKRLIIK